MSNMYVIVLKDDKSLTGSVKRTLYQREKLADQIQFLVPQKCGMVDLTECTAILHYVDQGNMPHDEILAKDSELYKDRMQFFLPVDSKLNYFAGNVSIRLYFMKINEETGESDNILITDNCLITIKPSDVINSIETNEKINVLQKQVEKLQKNQVNDLKLTDDLLQLSVDGETIGEGVKIQSGNGNCDCEDGTPVVDFNSESDSPSTPDSEDKDSKTDEDNVVEF